MADPARAMRSCKHCAPRRPPLGRRLRHRLLLSVLPEPPAGPRGEDRPQLRHRRRHRRRQRCDRPIHRRPRPEPRPGRRRRGRRDQARLGPAPGDGLRHRAGLLRGPTDGTGAPARLAAALEPAAPGRVPRRWLRSRDGPPRRVDRTGRASGPAGRRVSGTCTGGSNRPVAASVSTSFSVSAWIRRTSSASSRSSAPIARARSQACTARSTVSCHR